MKSISIKHFLSLGLLILSMAIGTSIGIFFKPLSSFLAPWGELYINVLKMCVIPLVASAIISSISKFFHSKLLGKYLKKALLTFSIVFLGVSSFCFAFASISRIGKNISFLERIEIGKYIAKKEQNKEVFSLPDKEILAKQEKKEEHTHFSKIFFKMIPTNIFYALAFGNIFKIVFFSILLGIALGVVPFKYGGPLIANVFAIFKAFQKILRWILYLLPLGIACLFAGQIGDIGTGFLLAMLRFVAFYYLGVVLLVTIETFIMSRKLHFSFFSPLFLLKETLLVAFATSNPFVVLPTAIKTLQKEFKLEKDMVFFFLPLSFSLCAFGFVYTFGFISVYFAQFYDIVFSFSYMAIIIIGSIFVAIAGTSSPLIVAAAFLTLIFEPLGLPIKPAHFMLIGMSALINPMGVITTVYTNCMATTLMATKKKLVREKK